MRRARLWLALSDAEWQEQFGLLSPHQWSRNPFTRCSCSLCQPDRDEGHERRKRHGRDWKREALEDLAGA